MAQWLRSSRFGWPAVMVATVLAIPSVTGQIAWGWPVLVQMQALKATQLGHFNRLDFVVGQFLNLGPGAPLWLVGLVTLLVTPVLRPFRALGLLSLAIFLLLLVGGGKDYYFGPLDTLLIAAAACVIGTWVDRGSRRAVFAGILAFLILGGAALLPMGVPILPPPQMARYSAALGITQATRTNYGTTLPLPQDYADMTGWPELADAVASVFRSLSAEEQGRATIFGVNYGRAGAVALFGRKLGLPYPISVHGDFYLWGPGDKSGDPTIVVGGEADVLRKYCDDVTEAARAKNPWGVDEEQDVPILVCRRPKMDLPALFRKLGPHWS